jgi:GNAT superfamily N-acetyltransferase
MSVIIKKAETSKDIKKFASFANKMYKGNEYYVPSLIFDDLATFDKKKNAAFEFCDAEYYLAYKDGELVGRVAAIINHKANESWKVKQVRFGWFDFIDDIEVSSALLDAVIEFGKKAGMTQIAGPLGFTDFDPEGMLVEGFDKICTMALFYNYPYYPEHMKKLGYFKETGWLEYRITLPESVPERHMRIAEAVMQRYNLVAVKKTRKQILKEGYGQKFFQLINDTYCKLYGFSLLNERQIDNYVNLYMNFADMNLLSFIETKDGELVAAGVSIPSLAHALQKCRGNIFPFGWWHLLKALTWKKSDTIEFLLIGVLPEWQNKGVNSLIICDLLKKYLEGGFRYAETNANLETNTKIQAMWEPFEYTQHKKRWIFAKNL